MFTQLEIIGVLIFIILSVLLIYVCLKSEIKKLCSKSSNLRKYLPYFKKNFFKKLFLVGTNGLFSKGEIVANYIFIINAIITIILCIIHLFVLVKIMTIVLKIFIGIHGFFIFVMGVISHGFIGVK